MSKVSALILAVAVLCACSDAGSVDSTSQPDTSTTVSFSTTTLEPVAGVLQVDAPLSMSTVGFSQSSATVAGGQTSVELDGASITVPSGSATEGSDVSLSIFDAPPDDVDVELRASALPGPVDFTVHAAQTGPVAISIPVAEGVSEPMMIWFDPEADMWLPVPDAAFDPETRLVSASIDHLTLFDVLDAVERSVSSAVDWTVDRAVGGLSWVSYQTANVFGNRADPPSCSGELPGWVETVNVVDDRNAALYACGEADGDRLVVKAVANRGYSMTLTSTLPFTASPVASTDVGAAAGYAFQQALGSVDPSAGYVAAQSQALLVFNRPESLPDGGLVEIQGSLDGWSVLGDVAVKAFGASSLRYADLVELFECGVAAVEGSESVDLSGFDSVSEAVSVLASCVEVISEAAGRAVALKVLVALDIWDTSALFGDVAVDRLVDSAYLSLILDASEFATVGGPLVPDTSWQFRATGDWTDWMEDGVSNEPQFSGCSPGTSDTMPDGIWWGDVTDWDTDGLDFDLVCAFGFDPNADPLSFVISNDNPGTRRLSWATNAIAYPLERTSGAPGTPVSPAELVDLDSPMGNPALDPWSVPALIFVNGGVVTEIEMVFFS